MKQYILEIEGMQCGMCENHMNDAIRSHFRVKKVTSSHSKGETVIISQDEISESQAAKVVKNTGYELISFEEKPYEKKKGLFGLFGKR